MPKPIVIGNEIVVSHGMWGTEVGLEEFRKYTPEQVFQSSALAPLEVVDKLQEMGVDITIPDILYKAEKIHSYDQFIDLTELSIDDILDFLDDYDWRTTSLEPESDNTFNWMWFGPVLDFQAVTEQDYMGSGLYFVRQWLGGNDARGNYGSTEAYYAEGDENPFINWRLHHSITTDHGEILLYSNDSQGFVWGVIQDPTGVLGDEATSEDVENKLQWGVPVPFRGRRMFPDYGISQYRPRRRRRA
jgi:hypothetical protein